MSDPSAPHEPHLEDQLDRIVADYADAVSAGTQPAPRAYLERVPAEARPGLERCLKAIDAGASLPGDPLAHLAPGAKLGRFEIRRELGRGGMAIVLLANDPDLRRAVALKVLRPGLALERAHVDRFRREGHAMAALKHPGVVQVFEVGESRGLHWLAMEFAEGPSLATVIESLPNDRAPRAEDLARAVKRMELADAPSFEAAAAALLAPVARALEVAHAAGLVHRDIKPSNILFHGDGRALLADFGLAKAEGDAALSMTGAPIGTPHYMSPEQAHASASQVDHRTDIYSLGVTLYELIGRSRPFDGDSVLDVLDSIRNELPASLRNIAHGTSRDADAVCRRAMMREPERRYADVRAFADDLVRLAEGHGTNALTEEGGALRRALSLLRDFKTGRRLQYRSHAKFLGLPLVHIVSGYKRPGVKLPTAKAWFASGPKAVGAIACGGLSTGIVSLGGLSAGILSAGGLTLGVISWGGLAAGVFPAGGVAAGYRAIGGVALGHVAIGGLAIGTYALGGQGIGQYVIDSEQGVRDPEALGFFEDFIERRHLAYDSGLIREFLKDLRLQHQLEANDSASGSGRETGD